MGALLACYTSSVRPRNVPAKNGGNKSDISQEAEKNQDKYIIRSMESKTGQGRKELPCKNKLRRGRCWKQQRRAVRAEEMGPRVKCLLHKHEDLSLDPQHPCKSQGMTSFGEWHHAFLSQQQGKKRKENTPGSWPVCLAKPSPRICKRLSKTEGGEMIKEVTQWQPPVFTEMHTVCTCTCHTWTHIRREKEIVNNQSTQLRANHLQGNFHLHCHKGTTVCINMLPRVWDADTYCHIIRCLSLSAHQIEALWLSSRQLIK